MPSKKNNSSSTSRDHKVIFFLGFVIAVGSFYVLKPTLQEVKGISTRNNQVTQSTQVQQKTKLTCGDCAAAGKRSLCFNSKEKTAFCNESNSASTSDNSAIVCVKCGDITPTMSITPSPKPGCHMVKPSTCLQSNKACIEGQPCPTGCPPVWVCPTGTPPASH